MFLEVELTNFRQHRHLIVDFTEGLNAIRGPNEKGKTTLIEAISYLSFGTRALRESLADTVTWGEKDSTLKVRGRFEVNGVVYEATRAKSGAAIYLPGSESTPLATGQDEVKKFIEGLFGASADTASKMMMASQKNLQGALEDGSGAAVKLIETLADFDLIDRIISLIQKKLPNGVTKAAEARVTLLEGQYGPEPSDPTLRLAETAFAAQAAVLTAQQAESAAREAWTAHHPTAAAAEAILSAHKEKSAALARAEATVEQRKAQLDKIVLVPGPTAEELEELRKQVEDALRLNNAKGARRELDALPAPDNEWEGTHDSLMTERGTTASRINHVNKDIANLKQDHAVARASLITQAACGLCGKDLSQVPEVAQKNAALNEQMVAIEEQVAALELQRAQEQEALIALDAIVTANVQCQKVFQRHAEFIRLDDAYVPARWEWTGPDLSKPFSLTPATAYSEADAKAKAYQRALGQQEQAQLALAGAQADADALRVKVDAMKLSVEAAEVTLAHAANLSSDLFTAEDAAMKAQRELRDAETALSAAKALHAQALAHRQSIKEQLDAAHKDLKEMNVNNALIAKLRKAKPQIADVLWNVVTAGVADSFSRMRGVASKVTRQDNDFRIDGRSYKGLSGSTQDVFGLAVRVALTKMFLPNISFMSLDEPAAACDDEREVNMLGLIASSGFKQILLVTHSDQCESFAHKVVQL